MWPCSFISWVDHLLEQEQYHCLLQHFQNCFLPLRGFLGVFPPYHPNRHYPSCPCCYFCLHSPLHPCKVHSGKRCAIVANGSCNLQYVLWQPHSGAYKGISLFKKPKMYRAIFAPSNKKCMFQLPLGKLTPEFEIVPSTWRRRPSLRQMKWSDQSYPAICDSMGPKTEVMWAFSYLMEMARLFKYHHQSVFTIWW